MRTYTADDIERVLGTDCKILGPRTKCRFIRFAPVRSADDQSLTWIDSARTDRGQLAQETAASFVVCAGTLNPSPELLERRCFVIVDKPRQSMVLLGEALFPEDVAVGIHPTSVIHPEAVIDPTVSIGPLCVLGRCHIGAGTILDAQCYIGDNVSIGRRVRINPGAVIGMPGFGFVRMEDDSFRNFPHVGGVSIEDDVEIGVHAVIDRGALGDTVIREGAKIDNCVHIAHNVVVGRNCLVVAHSAIAGSCVVGDESWIAQSATIRDGVKVGSKALIGLGSVVLESVPDGAIWQGLGARPIKEVVAWQKKLQEK